MSTDGLQIQAALASSASSSASDSDGSLSHSRVGSLSAAQRKEAAVEGDDGAQLLVPGTHVTATSIITPSASLQPLPSPADDITAAPSIPTPIPSRPSSALTPPLSLSLPAARTFSSTANSAASIAALNGHDALNTSDSGLHLSGEKPQRSVTGSLQPTPPVPVSRQLSRQSSNSDAPLPSRPSSSQPQDAARVLRVTNEALSLRKQSLRHAAGSMTPPQPIEDVNTLRALLAFQNKEIGAYKQQITTLTTDNNRLAAEVRAFPHSASEVNRVISSMREERTRMDARIRALESDKKVWATQMRSLHSEMNNIEREWVKDRQRLEEAVRREEERNERLMAEWDNREERLAGLLRERKREAEEMERLKAELHDTEKRLEQSQAGYARLLAAWREERLMGSEVEGRLRGEVYARLFAVMREVADKEAESMEWEREMGRKKQVQAGVEELERRYTALMEAVSQRDELISRLREDNRRLIAMMQEDSAVKVRTMQTLDTDGLGRSAGPSRAPPARESHHTVHLRPVPFPSLETAVKAAQPNSAQPSAAQPVASSFHFQPPPHIAVTEANTATATAGHEDANAARAQQPSTSSMSSPLAAGAATHRSGQQPADDAQAGSHTATTATLSIPPRLYTASPSASGTASASPAALKSSTAYLSAFFSSAAANLLNKAEQPAGSAASTPRHNGGGGRSGQQQQEAEGGHEARMAAT